MESWRKVWREGLVPLLSSGSLEALRRGLGPDTALWMQRRYRLLFAFVGLAMVVRW